MPYTATERRASLAFNKSWVIALTAVSLIGVETFSGALRYYLDMAGASALLYLPKAACLALFGLELLTARLSRGGWLGLLLLVASSLLGMLHGASLSNVDFSLFIYSPLLFGLLCGGYLQQRKPLMVWAVGLCLAASIAGILLDKYTSVPWKGYSYTLGDTTVHGNTAWSDGGTDRPGGFARMSTTAAMMMALYALYLTAFTRARLLLAMLLAAAFAGILLTTNKSTAAAFALALMLLPILRQPLLCRLLFLLVVSLGIALPVLSVMIDFDGHATTDSSVLSSFYDRLVNTWPRVIDSIDTEGWGITGAGLGMVGSSIAMFPVFSAVMPSVTDSTPLYLWSTLGLGGLLLFGALLPVMARLASRQDWMSGALMTATFCITLISWTTDVLEVPVASLFLGLAVAHCLMRPAVSTVDLPFRAFNREPVFHAPRTV
ncbi:MULTISPECIES: hypothetical protein [Pseudomonas]|uniref:hypothetical protein n=1 Tax=Pseudomonas TaxID=286 RepID=UPI0015B3D5AD|nr:MULTISPECIES: hypothetical protein [Pseudomonas]MBF7144293.1 hypothetical protein [Pseudomonas sp. LY10J]